MAGLSNGATELVEAQQAHIARCQCQIDGDSGIAPQQRNQISLHLFVPIHLAGLQRAGGRRGVRDHLPLNLIEINHLATCGAVRRFLTRHVVGIPLIGNARACDEFGLDEFERPGADRLADRFERVGGGDMLGHDEGDRRAPLANELHEERQLLLQRDTDRAVVLCAPTIHELGGGLADHVARCPASQAGRAILRADRFAIVEFQPVTEPDQIAAPVVSR